MQIQQLYREHREILQKRTEVALAHWHFERLIIDAGESFVYFSDDRHAPFVATPHFRHWCPLNTEHNLLEIIPGKKPRLIFFKPDDFWHDKQPLGNPYWSQDFEIVQVSQRDEIWRSLTPGSMSTAYVGPFGQVAEQNGFSANPHRLVAMLDWNRSFKTEFEAFCTSEANRIAAKGHHAARAAFENGGSELEIHYAYLQGVGSLEQELPYGTIVALNEKSAILHYEFKRREKNGAVLLIDAGAKFEAYCSDITRTYCTKAAPAEFKAILDATEAMQLTLCGMAKPGVNYAELHHQSHLSVAKVLLDQGVLKGISQEAAIESGLTRVFFPHGLGHQLGIQVHDVAGQQSDPIGSPCMPPPQYPKLRSTRTLAPGMLLTVEPGIYFIPMLLDAHRAGKQSQAFNWKLIDQLIPFGGIRIEDDVLVTRDGFRNLTREHLPN